MLLHSGSNCFWKISWTILPLLVENIILEAYFSMVMWISVPEVVTTWIQYLSRNFIKSILFSLIARNFLNCCGTSWFLCWTVIWTDPTLALLLFYMTFLNHLSTGHWWRRLVRLGWNYCLLFCERCETSLKLRNITRMSVMVLFQLLNQPHLIIYIYAPLDTGIEWCCRSFSISSNSFGFTVLKTVPLR